MGENNIGWKGVCLLWNDGNIGKSDTCACWGGREGRGLSSGFQDLKRGWV